MFATRYLLYILPEEMSESYVDINSIVQVCIVLEVLVEVFKIKSTLFSHAIRYI